MVTDGAQPLAYAPGAWARRAAEVVAGSAGDGWSVRLATAADIGAITALERAGYGVASEAEWAFVAKANAGVLVVAYVATTIGGEGLPRSTSAARPPLDPTLDAANRVADSAADRAADQAANSAANQAADRAADQAADSAANQAADRAADSAADQAADQAADSAADQAADQAADSAADQAADRAADSAGDPAADDAAHGVIAGYGLALLTSGALPSLDATPDDTDAPTTLHVHDICVDARFRGRRIATALMGGFVELAATLGLSHMTAIAVNGAEALWCSIGWHLTDGEPPAGYPPGSLPLHRVVVPAG